MYLEKKMRVSFLQGTRRSPDDGELKKRLRIIQECCIFGESRTFKLSISMCDVDYAQIAETGSANRSSSKGTAWSPV